MMRRERERLPPSATFEVRNLRGTLSLIFDSTVTVSTYTWYSSHVYCVYIIILYNITQGKYRSHDVE